MGFNLLQSQRRSLPVEDPGVTLIGPHDVVLREQPGAACGQGRAVDPALARAGLLHHTHEDEVSRDQLQLIIILRGVGVHHPQGLEEGGGVGAQSRS